MVKPTYFSILRKTSVPNQIVINMAISYSIAIPYREVEGGIVPTKTASTLKTDSTLNPLMALTRIFSVHSSIPKISKVNRIPNNIVKISKISKINSLY